ncbi:MAG: AAA family ATPase, partial [Thermovirga sp.]|nr:AAA family ATPase [Thermovirga sp.]
SYISLKKIGALDLEELDKIVPDSLLDEFLFPKHQVESILSLLPEDHIYTIFAQIFTPDILTYLLVAHYSAIYKTRRALDARTIMQYWMTADFVRSGTYDFDTSRRIVSEEIARFEHSSKGKDKKILKEDIVAILSKPFSLRLKKELVPLLLDRKLISPEKADSLFDKGKTFNETLETVQQYLFARETLSDLDRQIITEKLNVWSASIKDMADKILQRWLVWQRCLHEEINQLRKDILIPDDRKDESCLEDINSLLCYLFPRVYLDIPRLKELKKPLILFIHGSAGVGKSSVGNVVAKKLGIPTYFRSTITREVLRHFIPPFVGQEIHRSSYQGRPTIEGFYNQGLCVAKAIEANLDRAIKENTSVMIEAGMLLPGMLSSEYYERANVVEVFLSAPENKITHRRMVVASKSLAMDKQKRLHNFTSIRLLDDVLKKMAKNRHITVIENKNIEKMIAGVISRVLNPYVDRWVETINDSIISKVKKDQANKDQILHDHYIRLSITGERLRKQEESFPARIKTILNIIGQEKVASLVTSHLHTLSNTQEQLVKLRSEEFKILRYLLSQMDKTYDDIRQNLFYILNNVRNVSHLVDNLKELLYPILISNLRRELAQDGYQPDDLLGKGSYESLVYDLWEISEVKDVHNEKYRSMVKRWGEEIKTYAQAYFFARSKWKELYRKEREKLCQNREIAKWISKGIKEKELHELLRLYYRRFIPGVNHLKGLDKPLIVLITGSSGVGKSTIAKAIKRMFNIPTAFSTDLLREDIRNLVPRDVWPQVHTSSFKIEKTLRQSLLQKYEKAKNTKTEKTFMEKWKKKILEHYYSHSLVILEGLQAALNRQIERNHSAVIEGIPLVPGALPAHYYSNSNIVQIVVTVDDENQHLSRWDKRALEQPNRYKESSERYKEDFIPIRFITSHLKRLARSTNVRIINNVDLGQAIEAAVESVEGPYADRFVFVKDKIRKDVCSHLSYRSREPLKIWGAWCTDIDDTVIWSGQQPTEDQMATVNNFIRVLALKKVAWIPMSGAAFEKIKPRILDKILPDLKEHVMFYGGDGSMKYLYNKQRKQWEKDSVFERMLSNAQAIAIMGLEAFRRQLSLHLSAEKQLPLNSSTITREVEQAIYSAQIVLKKNGFDSVGGIIGDLKDVLQSDGFDPAKSELYYRGGSVSWMMLGDIDAESYARPKAKKVREKLLALVDKKLKHYDYLKTLSLSKTKVLKPFPGARGIKFVLEGNDKERSMRDIIKTHGLLPEEMIFVGNELIEGGNDFVVTNIKGLNLLSLGHKTENGITCGGLGIEANQKWYNLLINLLVDLPLNGGETWVDLLYRVQSGKIKIEK